MFDLIEFFENASCNEYKVEFVVMVTNLLKDRL